jgi:hypothetical protein
MQAWTYATQAEARLVIDAITLAQGATETLTLDGVSFTAPRKTWAYPIELLDGTWAVPHKKRLDAIGGIDVVVRGEKVRVKPEAAQREIEDAQRRER